LILRIFFPRIEISNIGRVPARGPVILVVNHPNGLIDPLFLLCLSPRPVSFLAKAPLFDMPVIGWFVKTLGSIPVYRRQDEGFVSEKNRQTFDRARAILAGGGVIAVFPEGASHDDPKLRPLKTGAARIALGANAAAGAGDAPLSIAPMGIYYTAKGIFRSEALLYFGQPIAVAPTSLDANGEPPPDEVRRLTDQAGDLVFLDLPGRIAKLLLNLAGEAGSGGESGVEIPFSQSDLAQMVGASRQTVNHVLRGFQATGYISLSGRMLRVLRPDALRRRASE